MSDCSTNAMKPKDNTMAFLSALDRRFPPKGVAHLEGTEWNTVAPHGFPDSVVFANDGSVLDGTYETRRYVPEQRCQQLEQVARELYGLCESLMEQVGDAATESDAQLRCSAALGAVTGAGHCLEHARERLEALGESVDD